MLCSFEIQIFIRANLTSSWSRFDEHASFYDFARCNNWIQSKVTYYDSNWSENSYCIVQISHKRLLSRTLVTTWTIEVEATLRPEKILFHLVPSQNSSTCQTMCCQRQPLLFVFSFLFSASQNSLGGGRHQQTDRRRENFWMLVSYTLVACWSSVSIGVSISHLSNVVEKKARLKKTLHISASTLAGKSVIRTGSRTHDM